MHKDGIKDILKKYKTVAEKKKLITTLSFLNDNKLFTDNKGLDLISEIKKTLVKKQRNKEK